MQTKGNKKKNTILGNRERHTNEGKQKEKQVNEKFFKLEYGI